MSASQPSSRDSSQSSSQSPSKSSPQVAKPSILHRTSAALAFVEGTIVSGLGLFLMINSIFVKVEEPSAWVAEMVFAFLGSVGLIVASIGLRKGKNWGRAPVVIANLIALPVAYYLWTSGQIVIAIALGMIALPALITSWFSVPLSQATKSE